MESRYLYIVFSATPYTMGKVIRGFTGEAYNHVSIALDENLDRMYGFARRHYRTPLYGGFVRETRSRYHVKGQASQIRICRLPVSEEKYQALEQRLAEMHSRQHLYLYNHLGALAAMVHRNFPLRDAYICVEFVVEVLLQAKAVPGLQPGKYYSVGTLQELLAPYALYTGPMPETDSYDEAYYASKPVPHPILTTLKNMLALLHRLNTRSKAFPFREGGSPKG